MERDGWSVRMEGRRRHLTFLLFAASMPAPSPGAGPYCRSSALCFARAVRVRPALPHRAEQPNLAPCSRRSLTQRIFRESKTEWASLFPPSDGWLAAPLGVSGNDLEVGGRAWWLVG